MHNACAGKLGRALGLENFMRMAGYAAHHIVPKLDRRADAIRLHMTRLGFGAADLDAKWNGVWLKGGSGGYHSGLHTNRYFVELADRTAGASTRDEFLESLQTFHDELHDGTFIP